MHITRSLLAAATSLIWPTVVLVIPMGITLSAARVYAEAGIAPPPACTDSKVTACADAGALQACDCVNGLDCACTPSKCSAASGVREALVCEQVGLSCSRYVLAPCEGKAAGSACVQNDTGAPGTSGKCTVLSDGCLAKNDAGFYESAFPLACKAELPPPPPPATKSGDDDGGSGCSMSPGAIDNSIFLTIPFGLGLALALRRKRGR